MERLLELYQAIAIVRSKPDYGGIAYGTASNTTTIAQQPQHWIKTATRGVLYQPRQYVHRGMNLLWGSVGWNSPYINIWKLLHATTTRHFTSCMNFTKTKSDLYFSWPIGTGGMIWPLIVQIWKKKKTKTSIFLDHVIEIDMTKPCLYF